MSKAIRELDLGLDELGREMNDGQPVEAPAGYNAPPTLQEMIHRLVIQEVVRSRDNGELNQDDEADLVQDEDEDIDDLQLTPAELDFQLARLEDKARKREEKEAAKAKKELSKKGVKGEAPLDNGDDKAGPVPADSAGAVPAPPEEE